MNRLVFGLKERLMARFLPVEWRHKRERYQPIQLHGRALTDLDIRSFIEDDYESIILPSTDVIYYSVRAQREKEKLNTIVTAIVGKEIYGPVLMITAKELANEN
jgi:hypothetical protein